MSDADCRREGFSCSTSTKESLMRALSSAAGDSPELPAVPDSSEGGSEAMTRLAVARANTIKEDAEKLTKSFAFRLARGEGVRQPCACAPPSPEYLARK